MDAMIFSPETIGTSEYNYRSIVVGGGSKSLSNSSLRVYRGDSFICAAAIHAGLFSSRQGGSGVVSLTGEAKDFQSIKANGITTIEFGPTFPQSFTFLANAISKQSACRDPRWVLLVVIALFTAALSMFTASPLVFFVSTFCILYFYVGLASDPPDFKDYVAIVSWAFRGFLPASFVATIIYLFCVKHTLTNLKAQIEKTVLWLGACWIGALNNMTFDRLPLQRITPHDFKQPGAVLTFSLFSIAIFGITIVQALAFRDEGRLPRYLVFYAAVVFLLLLLMAIPGLNVRPHHYVVALILLAGTKIRTRPSLLYQGLLVGLFISGIARWGFDSILQTPGELFEHGYNNPVPRIEIPMIQSANDSLTFSWSNDLTGYDSMSILINDVERFRGSEDQNPESFTWKRLKQHEDEYFRFAYVKYGILSKSSAGRYSKPSIWHADGTWIQADPG